METMQKILNYIDNREDFLLMLWEKDSGWHTATKHSKILKDADFSQLDLFHLTKWIYKEDAPAFHVFLDQIEAAISGKPSCLTTNDRKTTIAVRLLSDNDSYIYQNIECWIDWDHNEIIRLFVMTDPLDIEEIHRIKVSEMYTADRNPALFQKQAADLIHANPDKKFAVIQFDVAKFKMIIADYGEQKSTDLLNFFISTLKVMCNSNQLFSRLSADVFMIVTPYENEQDLYDFVELLDEHLLGFDNMPYRIVYGICPIGDLTGGLRQYGDAAAMTRQSIKNDALQKVAFFRSTIKKDISTSKFIEDNMQRALDNGEFVMYLQPKINIPDSRVVGAEALVRWIMPGHGIVPPNDFVPVFEKNGFVIKMDQYIWEQACRLIRKWMDEGITPLPISINVSRRHLQNTNFIQVLDSLVDKYQIPKSCLEIEITETIDTASITDSMCLLKQHGFTLLMDDFGSGYSSLNTLKDTQFDVIKIDRTFLQDFISSSRGQKIVEHTIQMAKSIGLDMVAEGVETKDQAEFLRNCGCNTAQGFYYAKPMPVDEFESLYIR